MAEYKEILDWDDPVVDKQRDYYERQSRTRPINTQPFSCEDLAVRDYYTRPSRAFR